MKNYLFTKMLLGFLLCLPITIGAYGINKSSANQVSPTEKNLPEKPDGSFQDPIEYVLGKLEVYDLVMIGERHWVRQEPIFIQNLIKHCFKKNAINVVFLEFGNFEDQGKIDAFMAAPKYDPKLVIDVLRNSYEFGWGYQEYFDIFKLVYAENSKRPQSDRVKIVVVDGPPSGIHIDSELRKCFNDSSFPEREKWHKVTWLREGITDRDQFMAKVIEAYLFNGNPKKGIYYAGGSHIRKDLQKKDYGRRYFSTGGILSRQYPGRVCCLTFHKKPGFWQNASDFNCLEELFKSNEKSFALNTQDPRISYLKLKSDIVKEGIALNEAYDGYIMLNQNDDYQPCDFVLGFYDDEFAKVVWDKLRKRKILERLPPEFEKFKTETPTGDELMKMIRQGLH